MSQPPPEIPHGNRLLYASASFGSSVLSRATQAWLIFFYAPPADEDLPTIISKVVLLFVILPVVTVIDAVNDPLIGYWSDRTRTRWGRRIPFVLFATPFYVLFFFLLWTPPGAGGGAWVPALYFTAILFAQRIAGTLSGGPLEALLPEIARSSAARMSIVTWQFLFGALGAVIGLVASGVIKDAFGFPVMAAIVAIIAFVSRYIGLFGAWPYARTDVEPVHIGIIESLRQAFRNDQFLYFLPTFVFFNMAVLLLTASLPFFAKAIILGGEEKLHLSFLGHSFALGQGAVSSILFGATILVVILSLPWLYRLALRRGKARAYSGAMLMGCLVFPLLFFMGFLPGIHPLLQSVFFVALAGLSMAGVFTFPNAILADIIDYDALRTGMRREALYFGAQNTIEKWASALMFPLFVGLRLLGETADDPLGLRLVGPVAGAAALIGLLSFRGYRLPDSVTAETVALQEGRLKVNP